jgi:MFS transporter, DHA1 family, inner membrane transport protein
MSATPVSAKPAVRFTRPEIILLALMASINFSHIVDFVIMMPLGPILMKTFQINPKQFGFLVSAYTFAAGMSGFLSAFFIDRFDRKTCLTFFYTGFGVGTVACGLAPTYELLVAARFITGLFGGVLGSLVLAIVSDTISYERRGSAMGIVMGSFSLASVVGVPLGLKLATVFDWHIPFLSLGGLSLVLLSVTGFVLPAMKGHLGNRRATAIDTLKNIANSRPQKLALAFMFSLVLGQFTIITYLSQSFVANAGLREDQLFLIYMIGGTCTIFASPIVGRLADRYSKHRIFSISALISLIPIVVITNLGPHPTWMLLLISSSFFIVMSGRMVPGMTLISSVAPPESRGSFMSFLNCVQQFTAATAAAIAGLIVEDRGGHFVHYEKVGYIAVAFSLLAIYIAQKMPRGQVLPGAAPAPVIEH